MDKLEQMKLQVAADLARFEKKIENVEMECLNADHAALGSVLKGYEGYLTAKDTRRNRMARQPAKVEDYLFSLSSATSDVSCVQNAPLENEFIDGASGGFGRKTIPQKGYAQKGQLYSQKSYAQKGRR